MQLWRTVCSTDWKGRPNHTLTLVDTFHLDLAGRGLDQAYQLGPEAVALLIKRQNEDVDEWQEEDIQSYNENLEDGEEKTTEWAIEGLRWEMEERGRSAYARPALRQFVEGSEGYWTTTAYHLK